MGLSPPPESVAGQRYPLVLEIHGGPQAQYGNAFFHEMQVWASAGYLVLFTNPHGSIGYGTRFTEELRRHYGEKDMPDLMAALDAVFARGIVDETRIGHAWILSHHVVRGGRFSCARTAAFPVCPHFRCALRRRSPWRSAASDLTPGPRPLPPRPTG